MSGTTLGAIVLALSVAALLVFVGVGITEVTYASDHPYAYGPAKVIAWGAGAGALISLATALLGWSMTRARE